MVVVANVEAKKGEGGAKYQGMASDGGSHGLGLCWNTSYMSNSEYLVALSRNRSSPAGTQLPSDAQQT